MEYLQRRPTDVRPGYFYRASNTAIRVEPHSEAPSAAVSQAASLTSSPVLPKSIQVAGEKGRIILCVAAPKLGRRLKTHFVPITSLSQTRADEKFETLEEQMAFLPLGKTTPHLAGAHFQTVRTSVPSRFSDLTYLDCSDLYVLDLIDEVESLDQVVFVAPDEFERIQTLRKMVVGELTHPDLVRFQQTPNFNDPDDFPPLGGTGGNRHDRGTPDGKRASGTEAGEQWDGEQVKPVSKKPRGREQDETEMERIEEPEWTKGFALRLLLRSEA